MITYNLSAINTRGANIVVLKNINYENFIVSGVFPKEVHTVRMSGTSPVLFRLAWHLIIINQVSEVIIEGVILAKDIRLYPTRNIRYNFVLANEDDINQNFSILKCGKLFVVGDFERHARRFVGTEVDSLGLYAATGRVSIGPFRRVTQLYIKLGMLSRINPFDFDNKGVEQLTIKVISCHPLPFDVLKHATKLQSLRITRPNLEPIIVEKKSNKTVWDVIVETGLIKVRDLFSS